MTGYAPARLLSSPAVTGTALLGLGTARPDTTLSAAELGAPFGRSGEWITTRTGIDAVRRLAPGEDVAVLAAEAAASALRRAHRDAAEVDVVMVASCSIDNDGAGRIAAAVAPDAAWWLLNSACSGFCYAVSSADDLIRAGMARTVLIVAAEQMSDLLDADDLATSIVFGDGAGAAVVGVSEDGVAGIGPVVWGSDGKSGGLIACNERGTLAMSGREVFRWAVESMPAIAEEACRRANVTLADIAVFVPHQANGRIIDAMVARLGLDHAIIAHDISQSGNTSSASIPLALGRLLDNEPATSGALALLLGFGAGLAYAGQVIHLPVAS
jgi:3-oxoacyl-[acyl-carrier-protein] synthase-3